MPCFALNKVAHHVIGNTCTDGRLTPLFQRHGLVEHQSHGIMEARGRSPESQGNRVLVGAMEKTRPDPGLNRFLGKVPFSAAPRCGGLQHGTVRVHHEEFRDLPESAGRGLEQLPDALISLPVKPGCQCF